MSTYFIKSKLLFNFVLLMNNTYLTIAERVQASYTEKKSKFIALAYPVSSVEETKTILDQIRKDYYDARHVCWAYMIGAEREEFRSNDDGEPSGTAGKPILGQINSNQLSNILIAVVRYFGGIKLGTGGLIVAYRESAAAAIAESEIVERIVTKQIKFTFDYLQMNDVMKLIKENDCKILSQDFQLNCYLHIEMPQAIYPSTLERLTNITSVVVEEEESVD